MKTSLSDIETELKELKIEMERKENQLKHMNKEIKDLKARHTIPDIVLNKCINEFYRSNQWTLAQKDIMIICGRDLRESVLRKHPEIEKKFKCISWKIDQLTTVEKQELID